MNINKKCVSNMCAFLGMLSILVMMSSCNPAQNPNHELLTEHYPDLYTSVFERDDESLLDFTQDSIVANQAWRALISTPVSNIDTMITMVKEANTDVAWMALSLKTLTDEQLESLQSDFKSNPELRKGIARVLGRAGNRNALIFLAENLNTISGNSFEFEAALAMGRLFLDEELDEDRMQEVISIIFNNPDPMVQRAYLYGFYRADKILDPKITKEMIRYWDVSDPIVQQYLIRILSHNHIDFITSKYPENVASKSDARLAVELARTLSSNSLTAGGISTMTGLIKHSNRSVRVETFRRVAASDSLMRLHPEFLTGIENVYDDESEEAVIRMEAARTMSMLGMSGLNLSTLKSISEENPYYYQTYLSINSRIQPEEMPVACEGDDWEVLKNDDMRLFFAINELNAWWANSSENIKEQYLDKVQACLEYSLYEGGRSTVLASYGFASDTMVLPDFEYFSLEEMFKRFSLPGDVELYQFYGQLLKDRFSEQSKGLIDSLAAYNNAALNQTLLNQGWEIDVEETSGNAFRMADWQRLSQLGERPTMVLDTDIGTIKIQLYPEVAPATISGMDSLAKAGDYDGIAFHRVVQNFVIQGGDVQYGNGWGGPDYVVPTESSPLQYKRGMVGIASAGRDTEGSQYFIMHNWAPHLNGLYTIIGEVVEGMDVVDQVVVGDKVQKFRIIPDR